MDDSITKAYTDLAVAFNGVNDDGSVKSIHDAYRLFISEGESGKSFFIYTDIEDVDAGIAPIPENSLVVAITAFDESHNIKYGISCYGESLAIARKKKYTILAHNDAYGDTLVDIAKDDCVIRLILRGDSILNLHLIKLKHDSDDIFPQEYSLFFNIQFLSVYFNDKNVTKLNPTDWEHQGKYLFDFYIEAHDVLSKYIAIPPSDFLNEMLNAVMVTAIFHQSTPALHEKFPALAGVAFKTNVEPIFDAPNSNAVPVIENLYTIYDPTYEMFRLTQINNETDETIIDIVSPQTLGTYMLFEHISYPEGSPMNALLTMYRNVVQSIMNGESV